MERLSNWFKKYFIPHHKNDFKPHFLRPESVLVLFLIIIVVELAFLVQVFLVFDKTKFLAAVLPGVLASITNDERAENNVPPLVQNDLLAQAAQLKAEDMASKGYFAHTSPEGVTPWYWFQKVGYKYTSAGENLAVNFFDSEDVAEAWMNSPTHRANIVKAEFTEIGIGVARGEYQGRSTVFVAQLFGKPLSIPTLVPTLPTETPTPVPATPTPTQVATTPTPTTPAPTPVATTTTTTQILGEEVGSPTATAQKTTKESTIKLTVEKALTSPRQSVTYVYGGIALLVVLALILAIFIRFELQHPIMIARGMFLFAVVAGLLFVNIQVLNHDAKVPQNGITANVIEAIR